MLAVVLALSSSILWGLADFSGGTASRRLPVASVTVLSQAAGLLAILVAFSIGGGHGDGRALGLGALGGIGGGLGLAAFYRALAVGTMSIVSPIVACSALVPVGLALAGGGRPGARVLAGLAIALAGAGPASVEERGQGGGRGLGVLGALAAAAARGLGVARPGGRGRREAVGAARRRRRMAGHSGRRGR